mgnify:CR=1 FL=1
MMPKLVLGLMILFGATLVLRANESPPFAELAKHVEPVRRRSVDVEQDAGRHQMIENGEELRSAAERPGFRPDHSKMCR